MTSGEILDSFVLDFISKPNESVSYIYYPTELARPHFEGQKNKFIVHDLRRNLSPMAPFFEVLRDSNPPEELVERYAYPLQCEQLKSYFKTGVVCDRQDIVIIDELKYERQELMRTLENLYLDVCTGIHVVYNAHLMSREAIDFVNRLEEIKPNIKFIFIFDSTVVRFDKSFISDFIEAKQLNSNFLNIYTNQVVPAEKKVKITVPKAKELINHIRNVTAFLLSDNTEKICTLVNKYFDFLHVTERKKRELYFYIGYGYYSCGDTDQACLYLSKAIEAKRNDELSVNAMFFLSKAFYIKKMNTAAFRYASLVQQKMENNPDSKLYALSLMMQYFASDRSDSEYLKSKYHEATRLLRQAGLLNNYVNTVLNVPMPSINDSTQLHQEIHPMIFDCYYAVSRLRNKQGLSDVCNWLGIVYSREGNKEEATKMYNECSQIRQEIGDILNIVRVRNSLSYEALIVADYKKSYDLLNEYSERFVEIDNYRTIINSLRNMALPLMYTRHFDEAGKILSVMTQFMNMFDFEYKSINSFLPELNDILIYRSIVELSRSEYSHVQVNLYSILNNGKYISPAVRPLLNFLEAAIFLKDGNYVDALDLFDEGMKIDMELGERNLHLVTFCFYEFAILLKKFGRDADSQKYLEKGFEIAKENNFVYYTKGKDQANIIDYLIKGEKFGQFHVNLEDLKKNALAERLKNQIHSRVLSSQFLNMVTCAAIETKDLKHYLQKVLPYVLDYAMADGIYLANKVSGKWKIIASSVQEETKLISAKNWGQYDSSAYYFEAGRVFYDARDKIYYCNISKYNYEAGIVIVPGAQGSIGSDLLGVLSIAFNYIQAQLVLYGQKAHLIQESVYDVLTTLKNRRALSDYMVEQRDKIKEVSIQYTVGFIDLDNFKYFNDTFGHQAGDIMLKRFAEMMKRVYRNGDFLCRYGGDEFVVLIPAATCEEAASTAKRLYRELKEEQYFIPALEDLMEKRLDIPEQYHLGFSMGICSNFDIEDRSNLREVMKNADDALYYSKKHGKGRVILWKEIKDEIKEAKKDE